MARTRTQETSKPAKDLLSSARALLVAAKDLETSHDAAKALKPARKSEQLFRQCMSEGRSLDAAELGAGTAADLTASFLSQLGRADEALAPARRAVETFGRLAGRARGGERLPVEWHFVEACLCNALRMLAAIIGQDLANAETAMQPAVEALQIAEYLDTREPGRYPQELINALRVMAALEHRQMRSTEAVAYGERAVALMRKHPEPDFERHLASALTNLSAYEYRAGNKIRALALSEEAVMVYHDFIEHNPAAFEPKLGLLLHKNYRVATRNAARTEPSPDAKGLANAVEMLAGLIANATGAG